jgi:hypothetical protein
MIRIKRYCCLLLSLFIANAASAQLSNGATAPDFTFKDIYGNTQNLYSYLNAGKYVAIDVFATWCHPCWSYHTTGTLDSLYTIHDAPGDNTWKVLGIEADAGTSRADLYGTGTNTVGDWVTGTLFPLIDTSGLPLNDFTSDYNISYYPTLYVICPNKKVYQDTLNTPLKPPVSRWEYVANVLCGAAGLDNIKDGNPITIYPNPAKGEVTLYFSLNYSRTVKLSVTNLLGQALRSKDFGMLPAGDHSLRYDVSSLSRGIYFFNVSDDNNRTVRKKVVVN